MITIVPGFGKFVYNRFLMNMCTSRDINIDKILGNIQGVYRIIPIIYLYFARIMTKSTYIILELSSLDFEIPDWKSMHIGEVLCKGYSLPIDFWTYMNMLLWWNTLWYKYSLEGLAFFITLRRTFILVEFGHADFISLDRLRSKPQYLANDIGRKVQGDPKWLYYLQKCTNVWHGLKSHASLRLWRLRGEGILLVTTLHDGIKMLV